MGLLNSLMLLFCSAQPHRPVTRRNTPSVELDEQVRDVERVKAAYRLLDAFKKHRGVELMRLNRTRYVRRHVLPVQLRDAEVF